MSRSSPETETIDIVQRLRSDGNSWAQGLFNEAADEIERLRGTSPEPVAYPGLVSVLRSHANDCENMERWATPELAPLLRRAADVIEKDSRGHAPTPDLEPVAWVGWHPEKGYAPQTCGHDQQHAASLLMRTGIAGEHGWSVRPLYAASPDTSTDRAADDGGAESECDCQQPEEVNGIRMISNSCPVHNDNPDPPWPDSSPDRT